MPGRLQRPPQHGRPPPATLAKKTAREKVCEEVTCGAGRGRGHLPPAGRGRPCSAPTRALRGAGIEGGSPLEYRSFPARAAPREAGPGRADSGDSSARQAPLSRNSAWGNAPAASQTPETPQNCSDSVQRRGFYTHTRWDTPSPFPWVTAAANTSPRG